MENGFDDIGLDLAFCELFKTSVFIFKDRMDGPSLLEVQFMIYDRLNLDRANFAAALFAFSLLAPKP